MLGQEGAVRKAVPTKLGACNYSKYLVGVTTSCQQDYEADFPTTPDQASITLPQVYLSSSGPFLFYFNEIQAELALIYITNSTFGQFQLRIIFIDINSVINTIAFM